MRNALLTTTLLAALGAVGCFLDHGRDGSGSTESTLEVDVSIAGVSLGEDCGETGGLAPGRCAPEEDGGGAGAGEPSADCDGPCCGSYCQPSSVTFSIIADGDRSADFRVVSVTLLDGTDRSELMELTADTPRRWTDEGYVAWDEVVPTPSDMQTLYDLHGIDWSGVEDSYSRTYRLRVEVEVDGEVRTLTSEETTREAPIVT